MKTKTLMMCSATLMAVLGTLFTFAPSEVIVHFRAVPLPFFVLAIQVAGALYLGFATLNWMAKNNLLGGIYSRPVALGNFLHFLLFAIAIAKFCTANPRDPYLLAVALMYALLAVWFGSVTFGSPVERKAI